MKTQAGANSSYALFPLSLESGAPAEDRGHIADVSAKKDGSNPSVTTAKTVGSKHSGGDRALFFRWKGGVWLSPTFRGPWHPGDSHGAKRRRARLPPLSPCSFRPAAGAGTRLPLPHSSAVLGYAEYLLMAASAWASPIHFDRRRREKRDQRQPCNGACWCAFCFSPHSSVGE